MSAALFTFFASFIFTWVLIKYSYLHNHISSDFDLSGPQKFHLKIVPRIGGISIILGLFIGILLDSGIYKSTGFLLLVCSLPTFIIGLLEDITKSVSIRSRLIFTSISAFMVIYFLKIEIYKFDIPALDFLFLLPFFSVLFTVFSITGLANAYNIIDGFNGLSSMTGIITLLGLSAVSYFNNDLVALHLSLLMTFSIAGFFIWNYPRGLIFLGDGGAYLIGFWSGSLSVFLTTRHQEISPWFAIVINCYPILETIFTIYRRRIHQNKSAGQPDGIHFHTLIYRRILINKNHNESWISTNSRTAPYLWILSIIGITPAFLWWNSTTILVIAFSIFATIYIWLYSRIVKFNTPSWLRKLF